MDHSLILSVPADIFRCVADYLGRTDALRLKLVCRGLSKSTVLDEILFKYPIQFEDVREMRLQDWQYKSNGRERWEKFCNSIHDGNRSYVQKISLSHWASIEDFKWLDENLPNLQSLDISNIKDFVWTPAEIWTWRELLEACPNLFSRLQAIEVTDWSDFSAHSRVEFNYSYNDYTFRTIFRLCRRRSNGGSIPLTILPACTQLKTLSIRGSSRHSHVSFDEWRVHQQFCGFLNGLEQAPMSLTTLVLHDCSPFLPLLITEFRSTKKSNLSIIDVNMGAWMQEHRESFRGYPYIGHRMLPGQHHRDEESDFDSGCYESCTRNHMEIGQKLTLLGHGHSLGNMFQQFAELGTQQSDITLRPFESLHNVILNPFQLLNIRIASRHYIENPDIGELSGALKWMRKMGWRPIWHIDTLMSDVFPENVDAHSALKPKNEVMTHLKRLFEGLRALDLPVRLSIGERLISCTNSRSAYFGDFKHFVGNGDERKQVLEPTQARYNLSTITHLVDELIIQYPLDMPGVAGWGNTSRQLSKGEMEIITREKKGWRKFWARYALHLVNLKKLTVLVPRAIFEDWGRSKQLTQLLHDESWQVLELDVVSRRIDSAATDGLMLGRFINKKHPRLPFLKRVFFRQDNKLLQLNAEPMTEDMLNEENSFAENSEELTDVPKEEANRFWYGRKPEKRALQYSDMPPTKKPRLD